MNVIVSNKYAAMLSNLDIDLIKSINGEFEVDDLISQFTNFFFNKMILDITAIKGYRDINVIQQLSFGFDMNKVILLLDDSDIVNSPKYLSQLVSMGIYNFTRNIDSIPYLIKNPNIYKDVAQYHLLDDFDANENETTKKSKDKENYKNRLIDDTSTSMTGYGRSTRVIGFKNLTSHAGATTLIYMLKKQLEANYKVLALELGKNDFMYFNDPDLRSIDVSELESIIKNPSNSYDVILVDVNDDEEAADCSEMLYLIEPTTIKLNKMVRKDRNILARIRLKKLILNRSVLGDADIKDFEYESKCVVFFNIPNIDDKKDKHRVLDELLNKMGFDRQKPTKDSGAMKLFGIVKE